MVAIIKCDSNCTLESWTGGLGFSAQKYYPVSQYWLGTYSQHQKFCRLTPNPFNKLLWNFSNLIEFSTNWLTKWCLQPSISKQWKGQWAWFLCCSMLHIPFCESQQLNRMPPLSVSVLFGDNERWRFAIVQYGFPMALSCFSKVTWIHSRLHFYL